MGERRNDFVVSRKLMNHVISLPDQTMVWQLPKPTVVRQVGLYLMEAVVH